MAISNVNTLSNAMPSKDRSPMLDPYGRIPAMLWTPRIVVKLAAYTVLPEESGTIFTTKGATTAIVFTLPAIGDGPWLFIFANAADVDMTVTAAAADTLIGFNDLDLDSIALSTSSEKIGGGLLVFSDGVSLHALALPGDPRYQTYTLAD